MLPEALGWGNGIDWSNHTLGRSQVKYPLNPTLGLPFLLFLSLIPTLVIEKCSALAASLIDAHTGDTLQAVSLGAGMVLRDSNELLLTVACIPIV